MKGSKSSESPSLRVLHAPACVGGQPVGLARAERAIGLQSSCLATGHQAQLYGADQVLWTEDTPWWQREKRRLAWIWRSAHDYDLIHYNFGATIAHPPLFPFRYRNRWPVAAAFALFYVYAFWIQLWELQLVRRKGRPMVVTYQGDDARQGKALLQRYAHSMANEVDRQYYSALSDMRKRWHIRRLAKYTSHSFALNPDLVPLLPEGSEWLPYAHIDPRQIKPSNQPPNPTRRLVHAPTQRKVKGTAYLLAAVSELQQEGVAVELELVEGVPYPEALKRYAEADIIVDQLIAGWYGGFAVECMAMGKPVVAFIREEDLRYIPRAVAQDLPLINANHQNITDVLRKLLKVSDAQLAQLGEASRKYVEKWHDPLAIARRCKEVYHQAMSTARPSQSGGLHVRH